MTRSVGSCKMDIEESQEPRPSMRYAPEHKTMNPQEHKKNRHPQITMLRFLILKFLPFSEAQTGWKQKES